MKKLKIMLLSFALLAIVGGALAFKAKSTTRYCTATIEASPNFCLDAFGANKTCPDLVFSTTLNATQLYCYTTPRNLGGGIFDCKQVVNGIVVDKTCITTPTSLKAD